MKAIVIIYILGLSSTAWGLSDEMKEMAKMVHDTCIAESGASEEMVEGTKSGKFPAEKPLKCYMKCIFSNVGALDDDGVMDPDAFEAIIPEDYKDILPSIQKCKHISGSDPCDVAYDFNKCIYEADPKSYMMI